MKSFCVVCLLILMAIVTFTEAYVPTKCIQDHDKCQSSRQCCTGNCYNKRCTPVSGHPKPSENPCHYHKCSSGQHCVLRQVQCFREPCNPIPVCVPQEPCNN